MTMICSVCKKKITKDNFWEHIHEDYEFKETAHNKERMQ